MVHIGPGMFAPHWMVLGAVLILAVTMAALAATLYYRQPVGRGRLNTYGDPRLRSMGASQDPLGNLGHSEAAEAQDTIIVLPDISGYTDFIAFSRFSIAHAQYVVSELLLAVIEEAKDALDISQTEGDAILLYARDSGGPAVRAKIADAIVGLIAAFYQRRDQLLCANACGCVACASIRRLELKVVVHRGLVLQSMIGGHHNLAGLAVIEAHRWLKNLVEPARYVLMTRAAEEALDLPFAARRSEHGETDPRLGRLEACVYQFEIDDLPVSMAAVPSTAARAADLCKKITANLRAAPTATTPEAR